jgi:hypothetical protein
MCLDCIKAGAFCLSRVSHGLGGRHLQLTNEQEWNIQHYKEKASVSKSFNLPISVFFFFSKK